MVIPSSNLARKAETPSNSAVENETVSGSYNETCVCGVFLTGQFKRGSPKPPTGNPVVSVEPDDPVPCGSSGVKKCTTKCLEVVSRHQTIDYACLQVSVNLFNHSNSTITIFSSNLRKYSKHFS